MHSVGEPSIKEICGKPTYEQIVTNDASSARVVGGQNCLKGACPWQASIIDENAKHFCGGSVIDDHHILTAAHCFKKRRNFASLRILLGKTDLQSSETSAQTHRIAEVFEHEDYHHDKKENDIAILRTVDKIYFNAYVIPVCLPEMGSNPYSTTQRHALVSGWGIMRVIDRDDTVISNKLRIAGVPLIATSDCQEHWQAYRESNPSSVQIHQTIDDTTICAGGGLVDSCEGDSGGPLVSIEQDGRYKQIGIVSWGVRAADCGKHGTPPGVYARVEPHLPWIYAQLEKFQRLQSISTSWRMCGDEEFQCPNGWCISQPRVCDGNEDCKGGQDEMGCDQLETICGTHLQSPNDTRIPNIYVENPWMVVVYYKNKDKIEPLCGGVILDSLHILTAPDPIFDENSPSSFSIHHGAYLITSELPSISQQSHQVESIFERESLVIIRLQKMIKFNDFLRPICIGSALTTSPELIAVGWKETTDKSWGDPLTAGKVEPVDCECECNCDESDYYCFCDDCKRLENSHTCAHQPNSKGAFKLGDVVVRQQNGRTYLHGIIITGSHQIKTEFGYTEVNPKLIEILGSKLPSSSPTMCGIDQLQCPSGACIGKGRICDGVNDCKDGTDELICNPKPKKCISTMCLNGGLCINGQENCQCPSGYRGRQCQFNENLCANVTCNYGSLCRKGHCLCPAGLTGKNCEIDVNECASNPCLHGGKCYESGSTLPQKPIQLNSFYCDCRGTQFKGRRCENEPRTTCERLKPCLNGATCVDEIAGDYTCKCGPGYAGRHCEIDKCNPNPCQNGATCRHFNSSLRFQCLCPNGFEGETCQVNIDDCANVNCLNGGTCVDKVGKFTCECTEFWTGRRLERMINVL